MRTTALLLPAVLLPACTGLYTRSSMHLSRPHAGISLAARDAAVRVASAASVPDANVGQAVMSAEPRWAELASAVVHEASFASERTLHALVPARLLPWRRLGRLRAHGSRASAHAAWTLKH